MSPRRSLSAWADDHSLSLSLVRRHARQEGFPSDQVTFDSAEFRVIISQIDIDDPVPISTRNQTRLIRGTHRSTTNAPKSTPLVPDLPADKTEDTSTSKHEQEKKSKSKGGKNNKKGAPQVNKPNNTKPPSPYPVPPTGARPISEWAKEFGLKKAELETLALHINITPTTYLFGPRKTPKPGFTQEQVIAIENKYKSLVIPPAPKDVKSLPVRAQQLGMAIATLEKRALAAGITPGTYRFSPHNKVGKGLSNAEIAKIQRAQNPQRFKAAPKNVRSIHTWAQSFDTNRRTLEKLARAAGINPDTYLFETNTPGLGLSQKEINSIKKVYGPFTMEEAPQDVKSLHIWSKELKTSPRTLERLAHGAGIIPSSYLFGSRKIPGQGLSESEIKSIWEAYQPLQELSRQQVRTLSMSH